VGIQPNEGVGREGMSGAIIGMHMHDKTSTTAQSKDRQQHSRTIKTGTSAFKRAGREYSASLATGAQKLFGLWRVRFPPVLVRTGRRLPVQALGERRVWVALTGFWQVTALVRAIFFFAQFVPKSIFQNMKFILLKFIENFNKFQ
jgi:hypothetical protein